MVQRLTQTPYNSDLFFAIEIISLRPFHNHFIRSLFCDRPFAAVGIITGIAGCSAASRIICDYIVNEIFITSVGELVRVARLKKKGIAQSNFSYPIFIANAAAAGNDEVKLRLSLVRMIGTK